MAVLSQIVAPVVISIGTGVFFDHLAVKRYRAMARVGAEIKVKAGVKLLKKPPIAQRKLLPSLELYPALKRLILVLETGLFGKKKHLLVQGLVHHHLTT